MKHPIPYLLFAVGLALSPSCSCDSGDGNEQPDAGSEVDAGDASGRTISGTAINSHVTAAGEQQLAVDLSEEVIEVLVLDDSGSYSIFEGTGGADGTFSIEGVPDGPYLIRFGSTYRYATESTLDFGFDELGRPDAALASPGTTVTFDVDGMSPYDGDRIDFYSPNAASAAQSLEADLQPAPAADDTTIIGALDWSAVVQPGLVNQGDVAFLTKSSQTIAEGLEISTIEQFVEFDALEMTDGVNNIVSGTLQDAIADQPLNLAVNLEDWQPLFASFGPTELIPPQLTTEIFVSPFTIEKGDLGFVELARVVSGESSAVLLNYANPYPQEWSQYEFVSAFGFGLINQDASGDEPPTFGLSQYGAGDVLGGMTGGAIVPRIAPVDVVTVDDKNLALPQSSGPTPFLSWSSRGANSPDAYVIRVRQLSAQSALGVQVGFFLTTETSLPVPPGILESGEQYYFEILAIDNPGFSTSAPFRDTSPVRSFAGVPSAVLTVE